jgi:translation initiation factor eIF-2B subunit gamma
MYFSSFFRELPLLPHTSRTTWPRLKNFVKKEMSLIGDHVQLGENITYRQCFVGNNCKIGNRTKLNNCVIMDGVVIGDK